MLRLILVACVPLPAQGQHAGAVVTGRYRNLFVEAGVPKKKAAKKVDAVFHQRWAKDARERELSDRIQAFFAFTGTETYGSLFMLTGEPLNATHASGLIATNAVASLAATNPRAKEFVKALWEWLSMPHVSGRFRAWTPK